jgi:peptidoglycan-associated lipoprotein
LWIPFEKAQNLRYGNGSLRFGSHSPFFLYHYNRFEGGDSKMKNTRMLLLLFAVLALLTTACAKKAVEVQPAVTPPPTPVQPAPTPAPAPAPVPDTAAQEREAALNRFLNEYVHFDFDSAVLRPDTQSVLRDKAQFLQRYPDVQNVIIEGHCDERGTNAYNMALGARRAESVKQFMVNLGLASNRFETISYGEERPLDPGRNEEAWARNRRAAFVLAR